jgi:hypothetical protein
MRFGYEGFNRMKLNALFCVLLFATCLTPIGTKASDDANRDFQFILGGGVGKATSTMVTGGNKANFEGWLPDLETGLEIPWSQNSGILANVEYRSFELSNTVNSATSDEKIKGTSTSYKIGIFFGHFSFGGGASKDSFSVRQVSTLTGVSENSFNGQSSLAFASYSLYPKSFGRFDFEADYRSGKFGGNGYSDISFMMNFLILLKL